MHKKDREVVESIEKIAREKRFSTGISSSRRSFSSESVHLEQKVERKENPGFDCVIGNPPYDVIAEKEQGD